MSSFTVNSTQERSTTLKIPLVPAAFFGMVLGLAGLAGSWRQAAQSWGLPAVVGESLAALAALVWAVLIVLYVAKWVLAKEDALAELSHPVQCCFVGLLGVATMLVAGLGARYAWTPALALFIAGAVYTLTFAVWRTGGLWQGDRDPQTNTPVLYLPAVAGSFVTATIAAGLGYPHWGHLALGMGIFSWLAIESVLLHRLLTSPAMAAALRPTLGVQLAPAPVAAVAYLSTTGGQADMFVHALIGYGILQLLILLRLSRWIGEQSFTASYWAFTFGATALATASVRLAGGPEAGPLLVLAPPLFVIANLLVGAIAVLTIKSAFERTLVGKSVALSRGTKTLEI